jgi:hypothetical protein
LVPAKRARIGCGGYRYRAGCGGIGATACTDDRIGDGCGSRGDTGYDP